MKQSPSHGLKGIIPSLAKGYRMDTPLIRDQIRNEPNIPLSMTGMDVTRIKMALTCKQINGVFKLLYMHFILGKQIPIKTEYVTYITIYFLGARTQVSF